MLHLISVYPNHLLLIFAISIQFSFGNFEQEIDPWEVFSKVKFESTYFKEIDEYLYVPKFGHEIKALQGQKITIEGYYLPFDIGERSIILSKYPYSQCFFCGGAGPESVVEVNFIQDGLSFEPDEYLTVQGKLRLNADDIDHVNFILDEARFVSK
ncbi:DUF3299 domain-containing protein [Fulvivirgaceae bacterium BMA10]|uniref:DUF3299 domain-containing protein n=1 Tax=Splendidivirga corallicola TaxID=3051826 RepID=A0ABT8KXY9_9BACT|nr:DUF3299 domain-containing protein [Fulvivirgaceae bacterium BMA10]